MQENLSLSDNLIVLYEIYVLSTPCYSKMIVLKSIEIRIKVLNKYLSNYFLFLE